MIAPFLGVVTCALMPSLRVLAGPSPTSLTSVSSYVNSNVPFTISSPLFQGQVVINIQGFMDEHGCVLESEYFSREDRKGITWSIQLQGAFFSTIETKGNVVDSSSKVDS